MRGGLNTNFEEIVYEHVYIEVSVTCTHDADENVPYRVVCKKRLQCIHVFEIFVA